MKMVNMSSNLRMQNTIIDCYDMRKNEMFVIIDSLFNERIDYRIELLFVFRLRLSRVDNNFRFVKRSVTLSKSINKDLLN